MVKEGVGKKGVRNIFSGGVPFDSFELQKIKELQDYINENNITEIPPHFEDSERLKFLAANEYKLKETVKTIIDHL